MPQNFDIFIIMIIAFFGAVFVLTTFTLIGSFITIKKRGLKGLEIMVFVICLSVLCLAILYFILVGLMQLRISSFAVTQKFEIVMGKKYSIPVISSMFFNIKSYWLLSIMALASTLSSLGCVVALAIKWSIYKKISKLEESEKKEEEEKQSQIEGFLEKVKDDEDVAEMLIPKNNKAEKPVSEKKRRTKTVSPQQKALEDEIVASFCANSEDELIDIEKEDEYLSYIDPDSISIKKPRTERSRVLRERTVIKSDANQAYKQYLNDKRKADNNEDVDGDEN